MIFWRTSLSVITGESARAKMRRRVIAKNRTVWWFLQLFGLACLIVVVLTHIAEMLDLFPSMGWGLPNSVGHYLDFVSAVLAVTLLTVGTLADAVTRRKQTETLSSGSFKQRRELRK
jgi:hypothetical protein